MTENFHDEQISFWVEIKSFLLNHRRSLCGIEWNVCIENKSFNFMSLLSISTSDMRSKLNTLRPNAYRIRVKMCLSHLFVSLALCHLNNVLYLKGNHGQSPRKSKWLFFCRFCFPKECITNFFLITVKQVEITKTTVFYRIKFKFFFLSVVGHFLVCNKNTSYMR